MTKYAEDRYMSPAESPDKNPNDWVIKAFPESTARLHRRLDELELRTATQNFRDRLIPIVTLDLEDRTLSLTW